MPSSPVTGREDTPAGKIPESAGSGEVYPETDTRHTSPPTKKEVPGHPSGKPSESSTIGDTFGLTDRINEQIGSFKGDDNVTEMMKTKPLINLADAIGVNDKFLFIRELFNGSPESYNQAIARLNSAESLADARAVLMSFTGDNKEAKVVRQLLDLIKRKFPSDE